MDRSERGEWRLDVIAIERLACGLNGAERERQYRMELAGLPVANGPAGKRSGMAAIPVRSWRSVAIE